jgi:hypothetical protein
MSALIANVFDQLLSPITDHLTPEAAEEIVKFKIDAQTQAKVNELADRANEGLLTDEERAEYLSFVEAMDLIGILQCKARQMLLRRTGS